MIIVPLDSRSHNRSAFDCGVEALNNFLQTQANQDARRGVSRTYVLVRNRADSEILGFYTILLKKEPGYYFPEYAVDGEVIVMLLGRMGAVILVGSCSIHLSYGRTRPNREVTSLFGFIALLSFGGGRGRM